MNNDGIVQLIKGVKAPYPKFKERIYIVLHDAELSEKVNIDKPEKRQMVWNAYAESIESEVAPRIHQYAARPPFTARDALTKTPEQASAAVSSREFETYTIPSDFSDNVEDVVESLMTEYMFHSESVIKQMQCSMLVVLSWSKKRPLETKVYGANLSDLLRQSLVGN